jgi:Family of unknown function (DUF6535)
MVRIFYRLVGLNDPINVVKGRVMNDQSEDGPQSSSADEASEEREDFDDSANPLWSLYEKEAKNRDEAQILTLKDDMDGVLIFVCIYFLSAHCQPSNDISLKAGLFSAVLTAFVVPKIQNLQVDHAQQSAFYQGQSVQILAQISQQIASIGTQVPLNITQPATFPTFYPSASDRRVNVYWLMSLVFSLSAAFLATLVQQWVRSYMRVFQRSSNPLKTSRIRLFLFEGVELLPVVAEAVPGLIHVSLFLFFMGLCDAMLNIDTTVGVTTVVPIVVCGFLYLYSVVAPLTNPKSSYRNPFSGLIWYIIRKLRHAPFCRRLRDRMVGPEKMEARQEHLAMKQTEGRKARDMQAFRWLVENIIGSNEMETFVLAIPGTFNKEWGRKVWKAISNQDNSPSDGREVQLTPTDDHDDPDLLSPPEGTTVDDLCRCVRYLFETYHNEGDSMDEARRSRVHGYIETAASLVCCTEVQLRWFGEVGEVLSDVGQTEKINKLSTIRSHPSFAVRWTCLSLVAIRQMVMVEGSRVRALAGFAVSGIARFQLDYGAPDTAAFNGAQRIDGYLKTAWQHIENLHRTSKPGDLNRTEEEIEEILRDREVSISELERIEIEAGGIEDVDWRISLLQHAMGTATHELTRQLPGVSFNDLGPSDPVPKRNVFDFPLMGGTPIPPQFIFPGQQLQGLFTLGRGLHDIVEEQNAEKNVETVESLAFIDKIPVPLRRLKDLMIRQLWRLQDLRDGGGLGFTVELFFLALRQLSSAPSSPELKRVFYVGTFEVITCGWETIADLCGTERILLNLICDIVIKSRGVFSDFPYPDYIVDMLLELVGKMVDRHGNARPQIHDAVDELWGVNSRNMDRGLRDKALLALGPFPLPMDVSSSS